MMTFDQFLARMEEHVPKATIIALYSEMFSVWSSCEASGYRFDPVEVALGIVRIRCAEVLA